MKLRTKVKVKVNQGITSETEETILLEILNFAYTQDSVGVNFKYLIENITKVEGEEDKIEYKELSNHSFFITKEEADILADMVEPLIPNTVTSAFDYEFMKFYLGAKMEMFEAFKEKNPGLTLNDIKLI